MFLHQDTFGVSVASFGRAISFIEHNHDGTAHHLALIRVFDTIEDESAADTPYYVQEVQSTILVDVSAVVESIGRIPRVHEVEQPHVRSQARSRLRTERRFWIARSSRLELAMQ